MTRDLAKIKTIQKFTNLLDGTLLPGYSVAQVIHYYESQLLGISTDNPRRIDGIIANFMEDYVNGLANEQEEL